MGYVTDIGAGGTTLLRGGITTQAFVSDAVYAAGGGSIELTRGWSANAGYEHAWNPALKSSLFGGYVALDYSVGGLPDACNGARPREFFILSALAPARCGCRWPI